MAAQHQCHLAHVRAVPVPRRLTKSNFREPVNIGSDECVSMNDMAKAVMSIEGKDLKIRHIAGPEGVRGRNSDNTLIKEQLGWAPSMKLIVSGPGQVALGRPVALQCQPWLGMPCSVYPSARCSLRVISPLSSLHCAGWSHHHIQL
ncbi:MAG: hypothetical protein EBR88_09750, partial [Betaproteobacteria bacterium]|nr:hypothetical protein [Betaproteobacteria bacterium]